MAATRSIGFDKRYPQQLRGDGGGMVILDSLYQLVAFVTNTIDCNAVNYEPIFTGHQSY